MVRAKHRLSARAALKAERPGFYPDGDGLYLKVGPTGGKSWVFRYTRRGKARMMGLGPFDLISLAEAREAALEARKQLHAGIDPLEARRGAEAAEEARLRAILTFREASERFISAQTPKWANPKSPAQWTASLRDYAWPHFGDLPVDRIETNHVLKALEPIWNEKRETARRVRGRIENVLDWAGAMGQREGPNPARWRGHLRNLLPDDGLKAKAETRHHAALPYDQLPAFMQRLAKRTGVAARALEFTILTAARSGEVRGATLAEFDLEAGVWTISAARMKAGKEHSIPLSARALAIVKEMLAEFGKEGFVFPSTLKKKAQISDMTMSAVLRRMKIPGDVATVHGFRSTFRDWAGEETAFPRDLIEFSLAHTIQNKAEKAYRRMAALKRRRDLMDAWERFALTPPLARPGNVVEIGGRK